MANAKSERDQSDEPGKDSRTAMLAAGAAYFLNHAGIDPLRNLSLQLIAKRAGVSRTQAYRLWIDKKHYLADLTDYLVRDPNFFDTEDRLISKEAREVLDRPPLEALLRVAQVDLQSLTENKIWPAMEMLTIGYILNQPDLYPLAVSGYVEVDSVTYDWYRPILAKAGRKPRRPFTDKMIASIVQALVEGSGLREIFEPDVFLRRPSAAAHGGLYAFGVATLFTVMTTTEGDDRTVAEVLTELLDPTT